MDKNLLINRLELADSPTSFFIFEKLKEGEKSNVQNILQESCLYMITQRPVITIENLVPNREECFMKFEIHQKGNSEILKCKLPLSKFVNQQINVDIDYYSEPIRDNNNIRSIKILKSDGICHCWFSAEEFIYRYLRKTIDAEIDGNIGAFLKYKVLYVGKATEQNIVNRLTGHPKLLTILATESPINIGSLLRDEITLLFFKFEDNLNIQTGVSIEEILNQNLPNQKKIFLDAEKALINALQPKYCKQLYENYPKSKDGLEDCSFDTFSYTFTDIITLESDNREIVGGIDNCGDFIRIDDNKSINIIKSNLTKLNP